MRKILSLLTVFVLTSSSVASATAFTTNTNNKLLKINTTTDQKKANDIANKLKNTNIVLNIDLESKQEITNYKVNIKMELNKKLTKEEINIYDFVFINPYQKLIMDSQNIAIQVKVGTATSQAFNIEVSFNFKQIKIGGVTSKQIVYTTKQINNKIYVGTLNGLYVSSDSKGINFTKVIGRGLTTDDTFWINTIEYINNTIYIGSDHGLYASMDDGASFINLQNKGIPPYFKIITIKQIDNQIYVGTMFRGLWISTDLKGSVFQKVPQVLGQNYIFTTIKFKNKIFVGTDSGLYWKDATKTKYILVNGTLMNYRIQTMEIINNILYVGTDEGLWISKDGENFTIVNGFPQGEIIHSITKINNKIYVGTNDGIYISKDDDHSYLKLVNKGLPNGIWILSIKMINNKIYVGTCYRDLYYNFIS